MASARPRPSQTPASSRTAGTRFRRARAALCAVTVAAVVAATDLAAGAAPAGASTDYTAFTNHAAFTNYPVTYSFAAGIAAELLTPGASPLGANDFGCKPGAEHPYPVVLVHGTFGDMTDSWQALSPLLADHGYCVFALNYGGAPGGIIQGYQDIAAGAEQLSAFIDTVLAATGAAKVDIVGHSQGGMMPRYYLDFLGGAAKVGTLVGLSPSNHGTNLDGLFGLLNAFPGGSSFLGALCAACTQQAAGSSFLTNLNAGGDTVPGVRYTVIATRYDEVVTPYSSQFLSGPAVTNLTLQNQCGLDFADHLAVIYDPVALNDVLNALDPAHPIPVGCTLVLPVLGG